MRLSPMLGLCAAVLIPAAAAVAAPAGQPARQCFYTRDWQGWKAADRQGSAMYIRIGVSQIYKVGFSGTCSSLNSPGARLVTDSTNGQVCSPLDLNVKVTDSSGGFATPCIVSSVSRLTEAEVSQLPAKLKP